MISSPVSWGYLFTGVTKAMPIYEYECNSCCNVFEIFQRMTEDPLTTCPDCAGPVKKLVSMSSFKLKGGGWYADGYSNKSCNSSGTSTPATKTENPPKKEEKTKNTSTNSSAATKSKESCTTAI